MLTWRTSGPNCKKNTYISFSALQCLRAGHGRAHWAHRIHGLTGLGRLTVGSPCSLCSFWGLVTKKSDLGQVQVPLPFPFKSCSPGAFRDQIEKKLEKSIKSLTALTLAPAHRAHRANRARRTQTGSLGSPGLLGPLWFKNMILGRSQFPDIFPLESAHLAHFGTKSQKKQQNQEYHFLRRLGA